MLHGRLTYWRAVIAVIAAGSGPDMALVLRSNRLQGAHKRSHTEPSENSGDTVQYVQWPAKLH